MGTLNETASDLTTTINQESGSLVDALADMAGMISKDHHEAELSGMISKGHYEAELSITKLEKQNEIDELQIKLNAHKKELEQVKKELQLSKEAEDAVKKAQQAKKKEMMELLEQAREKVAVTMDAHSQ